jgi:DNA-binding NarL/FixJ family response regulator
MFGDEDNVLASIEAGALGDILKNAAPADIAHGCAVRAGLAPRPDFPALSGPLAAALFFVVFLACHWARL